MRKFIRNVYTLGLIFAVVAGLNAYLGLRHVTAPVRRELERKMEAELDFVIGEITSSFVSVERTLATAEYYIAMESETDKIERFLEELKNQNPSYLSVYFGTPKEDGTTPWYTAALTQEGDVVYTTNYVDKNIITASRSVLSSNQEVLGVVAIDVSLGNLMAFMDAGQADSQGNFLLLAEEGRFLDNQGYSDLEQGLFQEPTGMTSLKFGDTWGYLRWKAVNESSFTVGVFAPEEGLLNRGTQTQGFMLVVILSFVAASLLVFVFLRIHIVIPMRELGNDLRAISLDRDAGYRLPVGRSNTLGVFRQTLNASLQKAQEHHDRVSSQREELSEAYDRLKENEDTLQKQFLQIKENEERIRFLAECDALTKLPNRRRFEQDLKETLREGGSGAVFLLDVDDFKNINDTQGHIFGDHVLLSIAEVLKKGIPADATVYRFGGDEFVIIVPHKFAMERVQVYVTELAEKMRSIVLKEGKRSDLTCSLGIVRYPRDGDSADELLIKADVALHHAKNMGKDRFCFFEDHMAEMFNKRIHLERVLAEAVRNDRLYLVYQPIIAINSGQVVAFEALVRLENDDVLPSVFIPIAEEMDLTVTLGYWVIKEVMQQLARWQQEGHSPKAISVNLSPKQFHDPCLIDYLRGQLATTGIDPILFEVEFPEEVLLGDAEKALHIMEQIRSLGIAQSLDNYGIGYSFVSYVSKMPVDFVKIHGALLENIEDNPGVMDGLVAIAHGLGMEVVAVQVERVEEARGLAQINCDYLQGFLVSRPLRAEEAALMFDLDYTEALGLEN